MWRLAEVPARSQAPAPGASADFITQLFLADGEGLGPGIGVGMAQGFPKWPANPDSPSELASDPLSRSRRGKSLDP